MLGFSRVAIICVCILSGSAFAADLSTDMDGLSTSYKQFKKTENNEEAIAALEKMKTYALDAKNSIPMKLMNEPENSPEVKSYFKTLDALAMEVQKAEDLTKNNQLAQAKEETKEIDRIMSFGHHAFK
ncbi:hypothetical protein P256_02486 [Acinetobacter nectaris CIP 110549]|uniref:Soluble cytochrome b562 n=1 Tax=Acinetobacter nectaris CIP 110549 TaxID=1392540 RepID=V2T2L4_9GAMM|nr:cytochrome b562 [Acinetobacter nectaris]ESK36693.1 hypothetical protein P256_02486 [Acinetobacter nectaris CIP 110549]